MRGAYAGAMPRLLNPSEPAPAAVGFEQPFEMLQACHGKIRQMLELLDRLRAHLAAHGPDTHARSAARDVMRYFDLAAPHHHLDEERHVLPALEASGDAALQALARRLQREHSEMEREWAQVRATLSRIAQGDPAALQAGEERTLSSFASLYAGHIDAEEAAAFDAARDRLDAARRAAMSADMRARRGVA